MFYALIALCLFSGASAQLLGLWKCPDSVKPIDSLDLTKINGKWYKQQKYPMFFTAFSQCPWVKYESINDRHTKVEHGAYYARKNVQLYLGGKAHVKEIREPGKLVTTLVTAKFLRDYWVLGFSDDKDKEFLVIYSCRSYFLFHFKYLFIFTKSSKINDEILRAANEVLDISKLRTDKLQTINRDDCTDVDKDIVET